MNIYVCSTPYHILVSLLNIINSKESSTLILTTHEKKSEENFRILKLKLEELPFIQKVLVRKRNSILEKLMVEKVKDIFDYLRNKELYLSATCIYNFSWNPYFLYTTSNYIYKIANKVILIEDGSLMYNAPKPKKYKQLIKRHIYRISTTFYKDKKIKKILVQFPDKYPSHLQPKIELLDLKKYVNLLSEKDKKMLLSLFLSYEDKNSLLNLDFNNSVIILTQPLSEDGFINEREKIKLYQKIVSDHLNNLNNIVIIKRHPRETTTYGFKNTIEIDGAFPSELFSLLNIKFKKAVGICTSSVNFINAGEKINLDENFLSERKYILFREKLKK